ncbi:MAG: hypothetical protein ABI377_13510 [Devosia sp.]
MPVALVAAFELFAASLILRPNVDAAYRAYFIDKTSDCWPHDTAADYMLGTTLSFVEGKSNLFFPNKICGWFYPNEKGTWSYGAYSLLRFKFSPPSTPLRLTIIAGAMVDAKHPAQRVAVSANGQPLAALSFAGAEPEMRTVDIPASLASSGSLDIRFDYPDARSGQELGPNEDSHLRAIRMMSLTIDRTD